VNYFHVQDGYDVLPLKMADMFRQVGGTVHLQHRLKSFDQVTSGGSPAIEMRFEHGGAVRTVVARRLILAMPRRSLELLDQSGAVLGPDRNNRRVRDLITSVTPIPLFKLAICYPSPWWQTIDPQAHANGATELKKITQGESITDMPVRQVYYWAVDQKTQKAVVLIYDDGGDLDYWAGLRDQNHGEPFDSGEWDSAGATLPRWGDYQAPRLMIEEAHRQLMIMHGVQGHAGIPAPYAAAYRDWGEDPYGGGANFWHVGVNGREVFHDIIQPKPPIPVYICGEAYSNFQGWVEGPLETADQMLALHFGLQPPPWLPKS
jgi:monoamine oxidase